MYAGVIVNGDEQLIDKIINMHDSSDLQEEKMRLASSLGVVSNEDLINKVLKFAISVRLFIYKTNDCLIILSFSSLQYAHKIPFLLFVLLLVALQIQKQAI